MSATPIYDEVARLYPDTADILELRRRAIASIQRDIRKHTVRMLVAQSYIASVRLKYGVPRGRSLLEGITKT